MTSVSTKCCIVGAGVAGLKAAHSLINDKNSQFESNDVIIVEGQDYIGGRVKTDKTSSKIGYSYDIGAAWFHDNLTNVTLEESLDDGTLVDDDVYFDDSDMKYYDSNGEIAMNELKLNRVMEELEHFIELYYMETLDRPDMSLLEITDLYTQRYSSRLSSQQKKYLKHLIRYLELWFGVSSDKMSAKYAIMSHQGRNLYNKKGYSFLLDKLLAGIPNQQIHLNNKVTKINRKSHHGKILVETDKMSIECCYLVVTVPLSILALPESDPYSITWEPKLPDSVTDAINDIHFGALGKVIFEFEHCWWDEKCDRFYILPTDLDTTNLSQPLNNPTELKHPMLMVNYQPMHNRNQTQGASLVILTQSPLTDYVEAHPENAWGLMKPALKSLLVPNRTFIDPINVITSKWTTNPFIRGSYTAVEVNDNPDDVIIQLSGEHPGTALSNSCVRFAGEHTISEGDGCVHGAYMSGNREAQWIINRENGNRSHL